MPENSLRNIGEHNIRKSSLNLPELPDFTPQNVLIVILTLVVVVMGIYLYKPDLFKSLTGKTPPQVTGKKEEVKASGYSAVFLTNDQVYFGRLSDAEISYPKLREVYYLRVERKLQPPPATESAQPDLSLVKLGNELHGPIDEIKFNRDQILYIEELRTDSRVVKAIEEFKSRNK